MRTVFLVAYDVVDDKRRTKVFRKLKGFGESVQYSVFRCRLTEKERARLRTALWDLVDHSRDRVLMVNLGPDDGRGAEAFDAWGCPLEDRASHTGVLIV